MGTVSHTRELLEELEQHNANGNRSGYYSTLEQAGFRYGSLAGGVVREDSACCQGHAQRSSRYGVFVRESLWGLAPVSHAASDL